MTRHLAGLHPGAAVKQMIITLRHRLLRGAALHHAIVNISYATRSCYRDENRTNRHKNTRWSDLLHQLSEKAP